MWVLYSMEDKKQQKDTVLFSHDNTVPSHWGNLVEGVTTKTNGLSSTNMPMKSVQMRWKAHLEAPNNSLWIEEIV